MIITGTSYFPTLEDAQKYYTSHYNLQPDYKFNVILKRKIASKEIHIGKPPIKPGEKLFIRDNRYHIESP